MSLRVIGALWRASLLTSMQYRADFLLNAAMGLAWSVWSVLPLIFVYHHTDNVAGWSYPQALLVMAFFLFLRGVLDGFIDPNLRRLVELVREGTLDFVLLKPADAQLLVSLGRLTPGRVADLLASAALAAWCLHRLGHVPSAAQLAGAAACLLSGLAVLYSLWLCAAATTFWWVRVDALGFLLGAILDAGRWPIVVYRGWLRFVLTFLLPVTLMTSYPALALQGLLAPRHAIWAACAGLGFLLASRLVWWRALAAYTSASS